MTFEASPQRCCCIMRHLLDEDSRMETKFTGFWAFRAFNGDLLMCSGHICGNGVGVFLFSKGFWTLFMLRGLSIDKSFGCGSQNDCG